MPKFIVAADRNSTSRMPIDWSDNENNVRLLASTYAVLGKETVRKVPCKHVAN